MPTETFERRRHRTWLALILGLVAILAVGVAAVGLTLCARIDPKMVRARLVAAIEQEMGRQLRIDGPVTFHVLPRPEITASQITLSNIEGGKAPSMLIVRAAEADIAILPLLRHEVRLARLTLYAPQVAFERRADGVWNWEFTRQQRQAATAGTSATSAHHEPWSIGLDHLRIEGGAITVTDRTGGKDRVAKLDLRDLSADAVSSDQPGLRMRLRRNGLPVTIEARTGPLAAITQGWPNARWPLRVMALQDSGTGTSATIRAVGNLSGGPDARAFDLDLHGSAPDVAALQPLLPEVALPSMLTAAIATRVQGTLGSRGSAGPDVDIQSLHAQTGAARIGGINLVAGSVDAAAPASPVAVHLSLRYTPTPIMLTARIGSLQQVEDVARGLINAPAPIQSDAAARWISRLDAFTGKLTAPMPLTVAVDSSKATAVVDGNLAHDASELGLKVNAVDLQAVWARGPHLSNATLTAKLKSSAGGHLSIDDLVLHATEGDLAGRAGLGWNGQPGEKPQFNATLHAERIDTDALRQDTGSDPHAGLLAPHAEAVTTAGDRPQNVTSEDRSAGADASAGGTAPGKNVLPVDMKSWLDRPLPYHLLEEIDGAVAIQVDSLIASDATYKKLDSRAVFSSGRLQIEPITVTTPQGPIWGHLAADAATQTVALLLHAPTIPATSLRVVPGWNSAFDGVHAPIQVEADLRGTGRDARAVFGNLNGTLGLSNVDGSVSNALMARWSRALGGGQDRADKSANGLAGLARGLTSGLARIETRGDTRLRCLAIAAHISNGLATLDPIAFDTTRLSASGHGTMALANGELDLHMMASAMLGGTGASTPVHLTGIPGALAIAMDAGLPGGRFGIVIGGSGPPDPCPAALDAARFGQSGPAPQARKTDSKAADVLRGLGLLR